MTIHFGTDGWRGLIADDFTFDNVRSCAQGVASYLEETGQKQQGIVVGYDTRFGSANFAKAVMEVLTENEIPTYLCQRFAPTPVVSYNVIAREAAGAIIITASHNPAEWNGFKYRPEYAGSASVGVVQALERHIAKALRTDSLPESNAPTKVYHSDLLEEFDPAPAYFRHLNSLVNLDSLRQAGLTVVSDYMYGAGAGYFNVLLEGSSTQVYSLRGEPNPLFPGITQPEPIARNLEVLREEVVRRQAVVGLALDGDADRLGVVDEAGQYLTTLQVFALLVWYLLEVKGQRGPLVKSVTMTNMIYRLGERYGVPVYETPVGFKHLGPLMIAKDALAAGEESGGYAFRGHIPERDGILSGLYLVDMIAQTGKLISQLLRELEALVGPHHYDRADIFYEPKEASRINAQVTQAMPDNLAGTPVTSRDTLDGIRFRLADGSWCLIRFSGTEPLLRLYAEASSPDQVQALLVALREIAGT